MRKLLSLLVVAAVAAMFATAATQAFGDEEEEVRAKGQCSQGSTWELEVGREVGVVIHAGIETGVEGQFWRLTVAYNGHVLIRTVEETEEDGGFEVFKVENNSPGEDVGMLRASNQATGEICWGQLEADF